MKELKTVLVTGGAGYVGSVLVPKLIAEGYQVKVVDLYLYGRDVFDSIKGNPNLQEIEGDIRDRELLNREMPGTDIIIHLACISNDPSFDLDPALGRSINYEATLPLLKIAKENRVKRFIYASSSSVYGIKEETEVTENLPLEPLTDYARYKAECEDMVLNESTDDFIATVIRPATVCGYSPRLRLDLTVNILTNHAINKGIITVFGGEQKRPNIHIEDMTDLYVFLLKQPDFKIQCKVYNVGHENYKLRDIAEFVNISLGGDIPIKYTESNDLRSYHISSEKIHSDLGFKAVRTIQEAVLDLKNAFDQGKVKNPFDDQRYYNLKTMQGQKFHLLGG